MGIVVNEEQDRVWMRQALALADEAAKLGEVPIGAVVVQDGQCIGEGFNRTITDIDPSAHAEMVALRQAAQKVGNYRLVDATLYVTIEPCTMCVGLLVHSRIGRLVFGAAEPKAGAVCSASKVNEQLHFNHQFDVHSGIFAEEASAKMSDFFQHRRAMKKALRRRT